MTARALILSLLAAVPTVAGGMGGGAFGDYGMSGVGAGMSGCPNRVESSDPLGAIKSASDVWVESTNLDGSSNSTLTNKDTVSSIHNQGTLAAFTPSSSTYEPVYETGVRAGNDVLAFDGISDHIPMADADALDFVWETGIFELIAVVRIDTGGSNRPIIGNTFTGSELGFMLQAHSAGKARFFITTGTTTAAIVNSTATITVGDWWVIGVRGDGTNVDISTDLSTYATAARTQTYVAGAGADTISVMSDSPSDGTETDGALALLMVIDRELTAGERSSIVTHLNDNWGFSL